MANIKIFKQYHDTVIAFGDNGFQLNKRTVAELIELGIIAHQSQDPSILQVFESLPSIEELLKMKMTIAVQKVRDKTK